MARTYRRTKAAHEVKDYLSRSVKTGKKKWLRVKIYESPYSDAATYDHILVDHRMVQPITGKEREKRIAWFFSDSFRPHRDDRPNKKAYKRRDDKQLLND